MSENNIPIYVCCNAIQKKRKNKDGKIIIYYLCQDDYKSCSPETIMFGYDCYEPRSENGEKRIKKPTWMVPINHKFVRYAIKIIGTIKTDFKPMLQQWDRGEKVENGYKLENISITGQSKSYSNIEGAIFCVDDRCLVLHYSTYTIHFSVPKSNIIDYETIEYNEPQSIIITEWAYQHCYLEAINRILEQHGKDIYTVLNNKHSSHIDAKIREIAEKLKSINIDNIKEEIQIKMKYDENNKKRNENMVRPKNIENNRIIDHVVDLPKTKNVLHVNGIGNILNNIKKKDHGHYSVYLDEKNKWKRTEESLTPTQAEIMACIAGLIVAEDLKWNEVKIKTDSKNVLRWINGMETKIHTNMDEKWSTNNPTVLALMSKLVLQAQKFKNIAIYHIRRDRNIACSM